MYVGLILHSFLLSPPDCVDNRKLKKREEDEAGAGQEPDVNELDIIDLGHLIN